MEFEVVQMCEADLAEVAEIEELASLSRWGFDTYRQELLTNPDSVMLIARDLNSQSPCRGVLGFLAAWIVADEMHINNLGTHPDFRRQGVGKSLLREAMLEGRMRG